MSVFKNRNRTSFAHCHSRKVRACKLTLRGFKLDRLFLMVCYVFETMDILEAVTLPRACAGDRKVSPETAEIRVLSPWWGLGVNQAISFIYVWETSHFLPWRKAFRRVWFLSSPFLSLSHELGLRAPRWKGRHKGPASRSPVSVGKLPRPHH